MTAFQTWLEERIDQAGGFAAFTQKTGITSGRIYGWRHGALPQDRKAIEALAEVVGEDVQHLRNLVWQSQSLAPEVAGTSPSFRAVKPAAKTTRGVAAASAPPPAGGRSAERVTRLRRKGRRGPITRGLGVLLLSSGVVFGSNGINAPVSHASPLPVRESAREACSGLEGLCQVRRRRAA
jgi:hypothetical protein